MTTAAADLRFRLMAVEHVERVGRRIRQRRTELGLSREEVARAMPGKVSAQQLYRWEKGKHMPYPETLEALAGVLDTTVAAFMADPPAEGTADLMGTLRNGGDDGHDATLQQMQRQLDDMQQSLRRITDELLRLRPDD